VEKRRPRWLNNSNNQKETKDPNDFAAEFWSESCVGYQQCSCSENH
jgi:hypothetical protein